MPVSELRVDLGAINQNLRLAAQLAGGRAVLAAVKADAYGHGLVPVARSIEAELHLDDLPPEDALRRLVGFTFDHHLNNPAWIRLVMAENMERGSYLAQSKIIQELNVPAIEGIFAVYGFASFADDCCRWLQMPDVQIMRGGRH